MKAWQKISALAALGFSLGFGVIYAFFGSKTTHLNSSELGDTGAKPIDLDWAKLRELDVASGRASDALKAADGRYVKMPGFMIPLEDNSQEVSEFLLVPSPMACIHVPAPPPNQIVHVKMASGRRAKASYGPVWTYGRFHITEVTHAYGKASFELVGERTEPYN
jgi:uncharacterized protein